MPPSQPNSDAVEAAVQTLAEVESALKDGRTPRARKPLKEAARAFQEAQRPADAIRALLLLSDLEERREEPERALSAARAAHRLARRSGKADLEQTLGRLSRLHARGGDHPRAVAFAGERLALAREEGADRLSEALLACAVAHWGAGEHGEALSLAEEALARPGSTSAERLLSILLLQSGCPTEASVRLTKLTRATDDPASLIARGWCWISLDRPDSAARDFRRALRHAKESGDRRTEIQSSAALAAAENARSAGEPSEAREKRAGAISARVERMARRYRDPALAGLLSDLKEWSARGEIAVRNEAARALVELAASTDSLVLADAAVREVERLATLASEAPAYGCPLPVPLLLE